jgi:hypothetical protein
MVFLKMEDIVPCRQALPIGITVNTLSATANECSMQDEIAVPGCRERRHELDEAAMTKVQ